jgi:hypothetical protein
MMNMRRSYFSFLLSLLLVLVQHGAQLHEIGHLNHGERAGGAALRADTHALNNGLCATCEAFAQIANPAAPAANAVAVLPAGYLPTPAPCDRLGGVDAPTPRSRGPPQA